MHAGLTRAGGETGTEEERVWQLGSIVTLLSTYLPTPNEM